MSIRFAALAALALAACSAPSATKAPEPPPVSIDGLPAGDYTLDPAHASLSFTVDHLGFSHYTARFADFSAALKFDPQHPESAGVNADIKTMSLTLPTPPPGFHDTLMGAQWFDAAHFPDITYKSTSVTLTGDRSARIDGELTLHGVTRPVSLDATFNGGWAGIPQDPHARIGFSAHGAFSRSAFGIAFGVPPEGSTMGVGDEVSLTIEAEFSGPPLAATPENAAP